MRPSLAMPSLVGAVDGDLEVVEAGRVVHSRIAAAFWTGIDHHRSAEQDLRGASVSFVCEDKIAVKEIGRCRLLAGKVNHEAQVMPTVQFSRRREHGRVARGSVESIDVQGTRG